MTDEPPEGAGEPGIEVKKILTNPALAYTIAYIQT